LPAVYLSAAARSDSSPQETGKIDEATAQHWNHSAEVTSEELASLQLDLKADPDDPATRTKLLFYFRQHLETNGFTSQLLWFVQHYPNSQALEIAQFPHSVIAMQSAGTIQILQAAWEKAVASAPNSPSVLFNAARFFSQEDPERALSLVREAQGMDSSHAGWYTHLIAEVYVSAEMTMVHPSQRFVLDYIIHRPELATRIHHELGASDDPALLSDVGRMLADMNSRNSAEQRRAVQLIQRAIDLDPQNPTWREALDSAKAAPVRERNYENLTRPATAPVSVN
jgi:hypothetical protein